jgi:hypothetical protein
VQAVPRGQRAEFTADEGVSSSAHPLAHLFSAVLHTEPSGQSESAEHPRMHFCVALSQMSEAFGHSASAWQPRQTSAVGSQMLPSGQSACMRHPARQTNASQIFPEEHWASIRQPGMHRCDSQI